LSVEGKVGGGDDVLAEMTYKYNRESGEPAAIRAKRRKGTKMSHVKAEKCI
jgi:hypothetical protein